MKNTTRNFDYNLVKQLASNVKTKTEIEKLLGLKPSELNYVLKIDEKFAAAFNEGRATFKGVSCSAEPLGYE